MYKLQNINLLSVVSQKSEIADWEHCRRFQERPFSRLAMRERFLECERFKPSINVRGHEANINFGGG
jgi:hypothetical protein